MRNDSSCGSTIGPMMSAKLAMPTIDIGGAQLSMHSIREQCSTTSVDHAIKLYEVRLWRGCTSSHNNSAC